MVELIFDRTCPNVGAAREEIRAALSGLGLPAHWQEWDRGAVDSSPARRQYASPTVLVDGRDVVPASCLDSASGAGAVGCRLYEARSGEMLGYPPRDLITAALLAATNPRA